jgi:4a-hydroxytetrahydrobiopterin dehydratase
MSLADHRCVPNVVALDAAQVAAVMPGVPGWSVSGTSLVRTFELRNYHDTMAFVNAIAYMTHIQDHHPDMLVQYKQCTLRYSTHSVGGALSLNDFICAAKANAIYDQRSAA